MIPGKSSTPFLMGVPLPLNVGKGWSRPSVRVDIEYFNMGCLDLLSTLCGQCEKKRLRVCVGGGTSTSTLPIYVTVSLTDNPGNMYNLFVKGE